MARQLGKAAWTMRKATGRGGVAAALAGAVVLAAAGAARGADYYSPKSATLREIVKFGTTVDGIPGYTDTEGVIADPTHNGILFCLKNKDTSTPTSNQFNDLIYRYDIGTMNSITKVDANSGGTQGAYYKPDGMMVTCDRDTRQISLRSVTSIATKTVVTNNCGGTAYFGPNDIVVNSGGGMYFTDPNFEGTSGPPCDAVYYITPGGAVNRAISYTGADANARPNGILLSPDEKTLYVGLWQKSEVRMYSMANPASPVQIGSFAVTNPDGMTRDEWGNLYITRSGGVSCYGPTGGTPKWDLTVSSGASNVEIYGNMMYITGGRSFWSVELTPEPASLGVLGAGMGMLVMRRRRRGQGETRKALTR